MTQALYASFADPSLAEKAAGALMDHGANADDISIVANDTYGKARLESPDYVASNAGPAYAGAATGYTPSTADRAGNAAAGAGDRAAQAGDRAVAGVSGAVGATGTAASYNAAADQRAADAAIRSDVAVGAAYPAGVVATGPAYSSPAASANIGPVAGTTADLRDRDAADYVDENNPADTASHMEASAKGGISTTTGGDAAVGAAKGAGIGLGIGVLAGIGSLFIPGVGLVLGGGALATAIAATLGTAAGGAIAGGVEGYLKDQGVPDQIAADYNRTIQAGGAVLSMHLPSGTLGEVDARDLLAKYGAQNINLA